LLDCAIAVCDPAGLHRPTRQTVVERIAALRRARWAGKQIAAKSRISPATASRILHRRGLNKLSALESAEPVRRYERERPGELIHIDVKKLGHYARAGHRVTGERQGCPQCRRELGVRRCRHRRSLARRLRQGHGQ